MRKGLISVFVVSLVSALAGLWAQPAAAHGGHVFSIGDASITEGDGGGTQNGTMTVTVDPAPLLGETLTVDYATSAAPPSTATSGTDYTHTQGTLTFMALDASETISIPIVRDEDHEPNETFRVNIFNAQVDDCTTPCSGATVGIGDSQGVFTINDDDSPTLAIDNVTLAEGNSGTTAFTFTVTKTGATPSTVTVNYATANGTATTEDGDYAAASNTLTFAPADPTETITVNVNGDTKVEGNETFFVNLSGATNATIADAQGLGTINNDDFAADATVAIGDAEVTEGGELSFAVTLEPPPGLNDCATVDYDTQLTGTATSGTDYTAESGSLTFGPGESELPVTIATTGDSVDEPDETMNVVVSQPDTPCDADFTYDIAEANGEGTITDDDDPSATLSIGNATVTEGDGPGVIATFDVTLTGTTGQTVTADYVTQDGTATHLGDYATETGVVSFAPGETSKSIVIDITGDLVDEPQENFFVDLSNAMHGSLTDSQGVGTINDNDAAPQLEIGDATVTEGDAGTVTASFTVTKTGATAQTVTVDYATADDSATQPGDYASESGELTFAPGDTEKTIVVDVNGDTDDEDNETFFVNLTGEENATVSDAQGLGTITDDDDAAAPTISINNRAVTERRRSVCSLTVTLSAPSESTITVDYATQNRTATGADYVRESGVVTFTPGDTSEQIDIAIRTDSLSEGNERFRVLLSDVQPEGSATFADAIGACTIIDDD